MSFSLPVELLSYVFLLGAEEDVRANTPLVYAAVNTRWRHVARTTPRIWTRICVTIEDTSAYRAYLVLSRNAPLDIVVDGRDPHWDFDETNALFTPTLVHSAFDDLVPHAHRWRSLSVLTDTYQPMHAALSRLSTLSTPLLESLSLMRCNQFACYPTDFYPPHLTLPYFLPCTATTHRLRTLTLVGVHLDWDALAVMLSKGAALRELELSYHAQQVRPSVSQFRRMLGACPDLDTLRVKASGPVVREQEEAVVLPHLAHLELGYTDALDGCKTLDVLRAPNLTSFSLEDVSHPADTHDEDAECLLNYLSTGVIQLAPKKSSLVQDAPFPHLEALTLTRVKACTDAFKTLFDALRGDEEAPCGTDVDSDDDGTNVISLGTDVKVVHSQTPRDGGDDDDDDDGCSYACGCDGYDPWAPGNAFNDPTFDDWYRDRSVLSM